jgi:hypothetical protein
MFPDGGCESDDSKGERMSWDLMLSPDPRENLSHGCFAPTGAGEVATVGRDAACV